MRKHRAIKYQYQYKWGGEKDGLYIINITFSQNVLNSRLEVTKVLKLFKNIKKLFLNIHVWYNSEITVKNHFVLLNYGITKVLEKYVSSWIKMEVFFFKNMILFS